jgi:hypothetical protein
MSDDRDIFEREILPLFEEFRGEWLQEARATAAMLGSSGREITINDVRALCPPPEDVDPRVMGAVFTRKCWTLVRYERSNRATCHNRPVGVFRIKRPSMSPPTITADNISHRIDQYIKLRDKIKELDDAHKAKMKPYMEALETMNNALLDHLNRIGTDSTTAKGIGTVYRTKRVTATLADPEEFRRHVIGSEAWDLIDWRANKTAVTAHIDEHELPPPGVNYSVTYVAGVRRS